MISQTKQTEIATQATGEAYRLEIEQWRSAREAALRVPDGWLSLAGLFTLEEGEYSLGSDEQSRILLPPSAPATFGTLFFAQGKGTLHVTTDAPVMVDGAPLGNITEVALLDNGNGQRPTVVNVGSVSFNLHKFGNEIAVRVRDTASPAIAEFAGCRWYETQEAYRVQGQLTRFVAPTAISVVTSVRTQAEYQTIGEVDFLLLGRSLRLLVANASKPDELFIIFRDQTAGKETYGAGRYLYAAVDAAGVVTLDFNKAYNPPCAFTPYATCSWPPAENVLPVAIEAGELY